MAAESGFLQGLSKSARRAILELERLAKPTKWIDVSWVNSWQNYGSPYQDVQYRKVGDVVQLRGLARNNSSTATKELPMFYLPIGFRPPKSLIFSVSGHAVNDKNADLLAVNATLWPGGDNEKFAVRLNIGATTGAVAPDGNVEAGTSYMSLDGIWFSTAT